MTHPHSPPHTPSPYTHTPHSACMHVCTARCAMPYTYTLRSPTGPTGRGDSPPSPFPDLRSPTPRPFPLALDPPPHPVSPPSPPCPSLTQIVDKVNAERKPQVLEESVRILKQRLKTDIHKVVMLTLTLVESLVKNCQLHFHPYLAADKCTLPLASADRNPTSCVSTPCVSVLLLGSPLHSSYAFVLLPSLHASPSLHTPHTPRTPHAPHPYAYGRTTSFSLSLDSPARFACSVHLLDLPEDMKQMERLVLKGKKGGHDNLTEMEKSMELIESWGRAFLQVRGER